MKILKIELDQNEQNFIFNKIVDRFDEDTEEKQFTNFPLNSKVEIYAELQLSIEGYRECDTNAFITTSRSVNNFKIWYISGEEDLDVVFSDVSYQSKIDGKFYNKRAESIEERIINNYSL